MIAFLDILIHLNDLSKKDFFTLFCSPVSTLYFSCAYRKECVLVPFNVRICRELIGILAVSRVRANFLSSCRITDVILNYNAEDF